MSRQRDITLNRSEQRWLTSLVTMSVAPHTLHMSLWVSLFVALVIGLRLLGLGASQGRLPIRFLVLALTLGALLNIYSHHPVLFSKEAGVALLSSMLVLKLLEMRSRRELYLLSFLCFFTLVTQFLFVQEIWLVGWVLATTLGLLALLLSCNQDRPVDNWRQLLPAGKLLLQSVPLALVLFVMFPRLSGPLWNLGIDSNAATTGIGDTITPGNISQLARSKQPAFRVDFRDPIPPPTQRYWRGPVLWLTDGRTWKQVPQPPVAAPPLSKDGDTPVRYSISQEPSPRRWVYALDLPDTLAPDTALNIDYQLVTERANDRRQRYQLSSRPASRITWLSRRQRRMGLQLPDNITPRMRELVTRWQEDSAGEPAGIVSRALDYYRNQPFYYTLQPPLLEENPIDQFLFESRRGFCELYATSFTLLMRLAGIPSRVVAGYQGGEYNPIGNYLLVRQADAHAWSEVWLEGNGWLRVDPTAAVAPERIESSFDPGLALDLGQGAPISFTLSSGLLQRLGRQLAWGLDALNANWHRWVLGYSGERQQYLMQQLGLRFLKGMKLVIGLAVAAFVVVLVLTLVLRRQSRERVEPSIAAYRAFCRKLEAVGLARAGHEGPRDYARRVIRQRPGLKLPVSRITSLYLQIRYGKLADPAALARLRSQVRRFRPGRESP